MSADQSVGQPETVTEVQRQQIEDLRAALKLASRRLPFIAGYTASADPSPTGQAQARQAMDVTTQLERVLARTAPAEAGTEAIPG
ncbi:hypothetical protein [Streptomyces clavuligerus]|uniref:Uncharacterized protein n=1 Tax=Streptomyces clavuligerus TaxID=1901 RepID=Q6TMN2_STRCL|nr:hypothetical protein [Streptomyces clavuligerus]AAQ93591.1 hypothetical protein pSCL2.8.25.6c [Streptomyces clavuligerus]ANW22644.1 hypothetical protein BB341_30545 [Streptomyces clavuligerus]AXU17503.1 hypothetical protein D1794_33715 [Streptomyces clavuligerus]EDY52630.1 conserved hypothetical protein [Streptomyces clavuligerus]MBY6301036.1 hypothetical protein [Streptomyces clavuligerus]